MNKFKKQIALLLATVFYFFQTGNAQLSTLKFDVELELDHFVVSNVRDLDGTEDLYTSGRYNDAGVYMQLEKASVTTNESVSSLLLYQDMLSEGRFFWTKFWSTDVSYKNGTYRIDTRKTVFKNLTLNELKNIVLRVGGMLLFDHEGILPARPFLCYDCGQIDSDIPGFRDVRFIEMSSTQTSINNLVNNGMPQALSFGADKYFELNYYENSKKEDGWVKFKWMVWVTPHK